MQCVDINGVDSSCCNRLDNRNALEGYRDVQIARNVRLSDIKIANNIVKLAYASEILCLLVLVTLQTQLALKSTRQKEKDSPHIYQVNL